MSSCSLPDAKGLQGLGYAPGSYDLCRMRSLFTTVSILSRCSLLPVKGQLRELCASSKNTQHDLHACTASVTFSGLALMSSVYGSGTR